MYILRHVRYRLKRATGVSRERWGPVPEENEFMAEPEADFSFADSFTD